MIYILKKRNVLFILHSAYMWSIYRRILCTGNSLCRRRWKQWLVKRNLSDSAGARSETKIGTKRRQFLCRDGKLFSSPFHNTACSGTDQTTKIGLYSFIFYLNYLSSFTPTHNITWDRGENYRLIKILHFHGPISARARRIRCLI